MGGNRRALMRARPGWWSVEVRKLRQVPGLRQLKQVVCLQEVGHAHDGGPELTENRQVRGDVACKGLLGLHQVAEGNAGVDPAAVEDAAIARTWSGRINLR